MNREIKFKAWNKIENEMSYVFQIQYDDGVLLEVAVEDDDYPWDINDIELLQNTGLKDIRDDEIYEGDIVKWGHRNTSEYPPRIAVVEFKPDIQFRPINLKNNKPFYYGNFAYRDTEKYLEILGNIYENPELLEDSK